VNIGKFVSGITNMMNEDMDFYNERCVLCLMRD